MNDEIDFSATDAPAAPDPALQGPEQQAGAALRRVREAKGVHLVALASALKVPVSHLEHLEAGEFSALPDLVFAKALAASVCRHVGADPAEVMQWWPAVANPTLARPEPAHPVKPATFDPYPGRSGLGCGDDDQLGSGQQLRGRDGDIAGPGREVEQEDVKVAPPHIGEELLERAMQHRAAEGHRLGAATGLERQHRDRPHAVGLTRHDHALHDRGGSRDAEESGDGVAVDIGVDDADL
jgi:hypothetical protein